MYSGVSPQKSEARAWAYNHVEKNSFFNKTHIVIASRECGDIKWLLEHGVSKDKILSCDTDSIARATSKKYGVQQSPYQTIEGTVAWFAKNYGTNALASVNVDLCKTLPKGGEILNKVIEYVPMSVPVFFTFCRYRDRMHSSAERMRYFRKRIYSEVTPKIKEYQSITKDSIGSPMTVVVI